MPDLILNDLKRVYVARNVGLVCSLMTIQRVYAAERGTRAATCHR